MVDTHKDSHDNIAIVFPQSTIKQATGGKIRRLSDAGPLIACQFFVCIHGLGGLLFESAIRIVCAMCDYRQVHTGEAYLVRESQPKSRK